MSSSVRRLAVAMLVVVALGAAACGDDGGDDDDTGASGSGTEAEASGDEDEPEEETAGDDEEAEAPEEDELGEAVSDLIDAADLDEVDCLLPDDTVAELTGDEVTASGGSRGGSGGSAGTVEYSFEYVGCDYDLAGGGEVKIAVLIDNDDGTALEGFEQYAALVGQDDDAVAVADLGDGAVLNDEELVVRSGEHAFLIEGEDAAGDAFEPAVLQGLAAEVLAGSG